jgi:hypothetical protein
MATLVFSTVGTALGGPVGGAIGAIAGRQLDSALFGPAGRSGPRLRELEVSLSSYGMALPRIYGRLRVPGAIIWATELQEHSEMQGGGKGQPALARYSYTANLAVALSSRPITTVGRIWADGKLLRGAAGDLKAAGTVRVHTGAEDQDADPLIVAAEGEERCPAFRGLAYVVFEGLDLSDFGNRLPALTFEVIADDGVQLGAVLGETLADVQVRDDIEMMTGLAVEDSLAATLAVLEPVLPIGLDASGDAIVAHLPCDPVSPVMLDEPATAVEDDAFGAATGSSRRRAPAERQPPAVLRYLDVDRDYLSGTQHASGRAGKSQPDVIELPAALTSGAARELVERIAARRERAREQMAWRTATLDPAIAPGTHVRVPGRSGSWRVESWEWRAAGIELELTRTGAPARTGASTLPPAAFRAPVDLPVAQTRLVAFELPWDGSDGSPAGVRLAAAVGASGAVWSGAAVYADLGDGQLQPLGSTTRMRAVVGVALDQLTPASPLLFQRGGALTITLAAANQSLTSASAEQLAAGANLALVGDELIQFARAEPLSQGKWRLSGLIRGCGGTEAAVADHVPGEPFALLDARLTTLDPSAVGDASSTTIVALGRGDDRPATSPLRLAGIGLRPLAPVHARTVRLPGGGLRLAWTRRARGGWAWRDGADVPLVEESECYLIIYEEAGTTLRGWSVTTESLDLTGDELADLASRASDGAFAVHQQGTHGLSLPTPFTVS